MNIVVIPWGAPAQDWYRILQPAKYMNGVTLHTFNAPYNDADSEDFAKRAAKWLDELGDVKIDAVWSASSTAGAQVICDHFWEQGASVVGEVDDLFTEVPKGNFMFRYWDGPRMKRHLDFLTKETNRLVVSTPYLAKEYQGYCAPNFVDPEDWSEPPRESKARRQKEVDILCPYGNGRAGDYGTIAEPLKRALKLPNVKAVFMGSMPKWATDYPVGKVVYVQWVPLEQYPRFVGWVAPDLIVSPMERNNFNLAKSNLKWLEAGAVGACFVGEKWGEYERTVTHMETGVLCNSEEEWGDNLEWMCTDQSVWELIKLF